MSLIYNKKATFNYEIIEKLEAGIELLGHEVKSIRSSKGSLEGSYIIVRGGEAFLIGALISPYQANNLVQTQGYDDRRNRKILLHKQEIQRLADLGRGNGQTVVPISLFAKGRKIKLEMAIVRGKKKHDKRQTINDRETKRHIERTMKGQR